VCLKIPRKGPVHQCERGHNICAPCRDRLTECPLCRGAFKGARNFVFEKLLTKISHGCQFAEYGCQIEGTIALLKCHEEECRYRLVNCCFQTCRSYVSMTNLLEHIAKDHGREGFQTLHYKHSFKSALGMSLGDFDREGYWSPKLISEGGQTFFGMCERSPKGKWYFWIYMKGSKAECEKWTYTVRFHSKREEKKGLSFCGPCVPLDMPKKRAAELGLCLQFHDGTAKRFWSGERIDYELKIEKEE